MDRETYTRWQALLVPDSQECQHGSNGSMASEGLGICELKGERHREPAAEHVLPELVQQTQVGMLRFGKAGYGQRS
jgi:hypothetical protein